MKKYIDPIPDGGAPLHNNRLNTELQKEIWDVIEGIFEKYRTDAQGIIISGCTTSGIATNYNLGAGVVYIDGKFRRVPLTGGLNGTHYIEAAADVVTQKVFADGLSKNLLNEEVCVVAPGRALATQYIIIDHANLQDNRRLANLAFDLVSNYTTNESDRPLAANVAVDLKALIDDVVADLTAEINATDADISTLTANLNNEITNREADVNAEETARINADALKVSKAGDTMSGDLTSAAGGTFETGLQSAPTAQGGKRLKTIVYEGPDWNMDLNTNYFLDIPHATVPDITAKDVVSVFAQISPVTAWTSAINWYNLTQMFDGATGAMEGAIGSVSDGVDNVRIILTRRNGGFFDGSTYDAAKVRVCVTYLA